MRAIAIAVVAVLGCSHPSAPAPVAPAVVEPAPPPPALTALQRFERNAQGQAHYHRKEWAACATLLEEGEDFYDAACCRAQAGERDRAFALLERAITVQRFLDAAHLKVDSDLEPLHGDPRWPATVAAMQAASDERDRHRNPELRRLHDEDQADRRGPIEQIDWKVVGPRDDARLKRVDEIVKAGGAVVADDYYHAAMVHQHGAKPEEIQRAHDLAMQAVALDPKHKAARWLAAASEDRKLMYEQKPQKWGTQFKKLDGVWVVWEVDPAITDDQRAEWNVPPLAAARARAEQMNQAK